MRNHVVYEIDNLVGFGVVRMSEATAKVLLGDEETPGELEKHATGHHVGEIALIHPTQAAINDRRQEDEARECYRKEHVGSDHPDALGYYRARGRFLPGHEDHDQQVRISNLQTELDTLRKEREEATELEKIGNAQPRASEAPHGPAPETPEEYAQ